MVYSEVPNFSEPNPEYVAQQSQNKNVSIKIIPLGVKYWGVKFLLHHPLFQENLIPKFSVLKKY